MLGGFRLFFNENLESWNTLMFIVHVHCSLFPRCYSHLWWCFWFWNLNFNDCSWCFDFVDVAYSVTLLFQMRLNFMTSPWRHSSIQSVSIDMSRMHDLYAVKIQYLYHSQTIFVSNSTFVAQLMSSFTVLSDSSVVQFKRLPVCNRCLGTWIFNKYRFFSRNVRQLQSVSCNQFQRSGSDRCWYSDNN